MRYLLILLIVALSVGSCGEDEPGLSPEEYISLNNLDATELDNGVYIIIHEEGNDVKPTVSDVIEVTYTGRLTNEEEFDSNEDFKARLGDLIPGWFIGMQQIGEGGSCTLIIPYEMGFGTVENGPIPAKSTLIFEIELKNVFMTLTVDEYIAENNLDTQLLEKGVHIAVDEQGSDNTPSVDSQITVNYTGKLTNELVFDQGENVTFTLGNLIEGWQIGLSTLGEGGSCTLVIPAEVGYGASGSGSIPPNSALVFEIDLLEIK